MKQPYYLTTAIAYTSGKPHIGNSYEIILSDAIARYKREQGYDVRFQTGTDEHGQKIELKAADLGINPREFVDNIANEIKNNYDALNISYDNFIRTVDEYHVKQVQKIFKKLYEQGDIYKGEYEGLYCNPCESFWTESQLVDNKCPDCGREVKKAKEEAYFLNLSKYTERLIKHIEDNPNFIQPESRKNEMLNNFLRPGLQDLCVSRTSFKWGIPVDFDDKHVVYVWIDALSNYITGLGFDAEGNHDQLYNKYWPANVHIIGKDILRFHTIYWPIMLMALNQPLPKQVFGHPWVLCGDGKMSKSKGNVIYAEDLIKFFGLDATRYYCLHDIPYAQDGVLTFDLMIERINSDLANVLGNLLNRTISMANKYFDGKVINTKVYENIDDELIDAFKALKDKVDAKMDEFKTGDAIDEILKVLRRCNKYIDETLPWSLAKDDTKQERLHCVIYNLLNGLRISGIMLRSFLPDTSKSILEQINTKYTSYEDLKIDAFENEIQVTTSPIILFNRIDVEEKIAEIDEFYEANKGDEQSYIEFDDFSKLEMKVGTIKECEKHPKADKLLVSKIDIGGTYRQIVSGIANSYEPKELIGKQVIVVTNLKPAVIRGIESQGMVLAASNDDDLVLATVDTVIDNGSIVR